MNDPAMFQVTQMRSEPPAFDVPVILLLNTVLWMILVLLTAGVVRLISG